MYLDAAIIVKLLVDESDTDYFQDALAGALLSSSELAFTEVRAALLTKERNKLISAKQREAAWQVFTDRVRARDIELHPLNGLVLRKANHILGRCYPKVPLRTLDAIHTAACDLSQDFPLCTTDKRMRDAAGVLGIPIFPEAELPQT